MNKQTKLIIEIILGVALLLLVSASALGQEQPPPSEAGRISNILRSTHTGSFPTGTMVM
jgi:hypothetical protein